MQILSIKLNNDIIFVFFPPGLLKSLIICFLKKGNIFTIYFHSVTPIDLMIQNIKKTCVIYH